MLLLKFFIIDVLKFKCFRITICFSVINPFSLCKNANSLIGIYSVLIITYMFAVYTQYQVSQCTVNNKNVGKIFAVLVWKMLKKPIAKLTVCQENLSDSSTIHENDKAVILLPTFVVYSITFIA